MRAVWLTAFGGPEVLVAKETPEPSAGRGEVVVSVFFAGLTFVETQFRASGIGPFGLQPPAVLGNGVGGVVAEVGEGVDPALLGTRVVTATGGSGGYAERVAVDAGAVVPVPEGVPLDTAVALLADGRTALLNLRAVGPVAGQRVLVLAAAGGVGTLLVQLARAAGATVVGAAGGARKGELVRGLGAAEVVDYAEPGWTTDPVDVVFDGVGGELARTAFGLLRPGGRMLSYGLAGGRWSDVTAEEAAARGVTLVTGARPGPGQVRELVVAALAEAAAGRLAPVIGQRFPLAEAAAAHAAIESRATVGKTLLEVR
ncbi:zinc-binding dehydrogenase [Saccharothrix coeruleofusca]|uniref:NADPH:quinone reductase n=1 Tax=Saccharothrix coeruleofusca TaxID=33919 RepID=A0A918AN11_9PSEU|nr:zinc-binding dehydrogenase [Saccharothrix coeruleofusca]GGP63242.1 NADPH:quinone reductase [Saccharothrix coeruleofusca]